MSTGEAWVMGHSSPRAAMGVEKTWQGRALRWADVARL